MNRVGLSSLPLILIACPLFASESFIDWFMEPRFGLDRDGDGLMDVPNTAEYVQAQDAVCGAASGFPRFCVTFDGKGSRYEGTIAAYRWNIRGLEVNIEHVGISPEFSPLGGLPEGIYEVSLTLEGDRGSVTARRQVPIEDVLIVALGDSYSSGQGNPERPFPLGLAWADDGAGAQTPVGNGHVAAWRSTLAWPAQVALAVEQADPRTSVTFVFLSESGATLEKGGMAQLEQLAPLVGRRRIDALLLSFGGNDAGFADLILQLLKASPVLAAFPDIAMPGVDLDIGYDYAEKLEDIWWQSSRRIARLPELFDSFNRRINNIGLQVLNTFIIEYPEPGGRSVTEGRVERCDRIVAVSCDLLKKAGTLCLGTDNELCRNWETIQKACPILEGLFAPRTFEDVFSIDELELMGTVERFGDLLNEAVEFAASRHAWTFVSGVRAAFLDGHGDCMPYDGLYGGNPYPSPVPDDRTGQRWFRTVEDSMIIQSHVLGTVHPNEYGHQAVKRAVLERLLLPVDVGALGKDSDDQVLEAIVLPLIADGSLSKRGEIAQSSDVDLFALDIPEPGELELFLSFPLMSAKVVVRVFDATGLPLKVADGASGVKVSLGTVGRYIVGISGHGNAAYDPFTGLDDSPGDFVGAYEVVMVWSGAEVRFRRDDPNGDGMSDITDAIGVLNFLFNSGQLDCPRAGNTNGDALLDVSDPVYFLSFLFIGGPRPKEPSHECGTDVGATIECGTYPRCAG